ncbi:protein lin-54 homolog [Convolutriloba macropyga]|uniref:protein lin-54 homolog n=1 Tax=Convolutriloba macropyga TaxID=536237 RepID=UPI003F51E522
MENEPVPSSSAKLIKVPRMPRHMQPVAGAAKTLSSSNITPGKRDDATPTVFQIIPSQNVITAANLLPSGTQQIRSNSFQATSSEQTSSATLSQRSNSSTVTALPLAYQRNKEIASHGLQKMIVTQNTRPESKDTPPEHSQSKYQYTSASKQLWESIGGKKKSCSCARSLCLKLYCECFANGEFCFSCNCTNCYNTLENDFERNEAIRAILNRNPNAFHPKVGKVTFSEEKSHYKGCNCKKTNCIKNYCECYEAKILCTNLCKCVDCFNCQERAGLRSVGDVTALRILKEGTIRDMAFYRSDFFDKLPFTLMTQEVIEAIVQCLIAQAESSATAAMSQEETERLLMQEFGQCTNQIIENAPSFKPTSSLSGTSRN